jgi:uncharacterized protein YndB with AHSA1/START domain
MKPGIHTNSGSWAGARETRDERAGVGSALVSSPERQARFRSTAEWNTAIRVTRRFNAPPHRVFGAWLDPEVAGKWLFATASRPMARVAIDARVKGSFRLVERRDGKDVEYSGEYVEIAPPRRLVFTLSAENPRDITRVSVELAPVEPGCELVLTHENVPADDASRTEARWTGILYGLGVCLTLSPHITAAKPRAGKKRLSNSGPAERL